MNYALESISIGTAEIIITEEQFQLINLDVMKLKRHHDATKDSKDRLSDLEVNFYFRRLVQVYHPLLQKCANLMFAYDYLIAKTTVKRIKKNQYDIPVWTESYTIVTGFLWEFLLDYDPSSGVYFTHYLNLRFKWKALDVWKDLARRNGISTKKHKRKSYKVVSYDELINEKKEELNQKPKIVMFEDIVFDDNFDQIVFEWALEDPVQFVENYDLYQLLSTFTAKQTEAFILRLQGYKQKQVADELLEKKGVKITQQAVNERLVGVEKKIKEAGYEPIKE